MSLFQYKIPMRDTRTQPRRRFLRQAGGYTAQAAIATTAPLAAIDAMAQERKPLQFDVRAHGAAGDGKTLDTDAINRAIAAASQAGGGTVVFPAGQYLSFSIRLKSHVALYLDAGAVIIAADPATDNGAYDMWEPNPWDMYQDFGHSHWHNSLIWGEGLENISITGPGRIWGRGLFKGGPGPRRQPKAGDMPASLGAADPMGERPKAGQEFGVEMNGRGNKAIALKNCRNVILRDISILKGGHFALLATGVDSLTIDNLKVDTDRDGFDIDCCRNVRIANCGINTCNDDAICLKSSFALGYARFTENVSIINCQVSGFDLGSYLDGTFKRTQTIAPDREGVCGRIKFGTESNGGFRNITISNCVFERCRGLAIESVDGGVIEDVTVDNLAMRDLVNSPLFIRLGKRMRAPEGTPVGAIRRINISNIVVSNAAHEYASIVAGLKDHPIEDIRISNLVTIHAGGGTRADAERTIPENETQYPEPSMFGRTPSYGLFARHVRGLDVHHVDMRTTTPDQRPAVALHNVENVSIERARLQRANGVTIAVQDVKALSVSEVSGVKNAVRAAARKESL
jgi:polygalacturonase